MFQVMDPAWRTYLVVSAADWLLLGLAIVAAVRWFDMPAWPGVILLAVWIAKDLLLYPSARRYYESEPPQQRMIGERGEALCRLDPAGFARVHGEIWQVRVADDTIAIPAGAPIRVREVQGMRLLVDPVVAA
jgi:membrane protein implicated in regulation of membrane protease activity